MVLVTTRFRVEATDLNVLARNAERESHTEQDLYIRSWSFADFASSLHARFFSQYFPEYQRPLTLKAHRRLGMYIALLQDAFRMLAPLGLAVYVAERASKLLYDASLQCP